MDKIIINGGLTLNGTVKISGSKNAALPIMAACIIHPGKYTLNNVPILRDTITMGKLLELIGAKVKLENNTITINTSDCNSPVAPYELVKTMRASFYVLGPFMSRFNEAMVSLPGGCAWGPRPVDYHIKALREMGAIISLKNGYINAKGKLKGNTIVFDKSSVGATGNIMMAAISSDGLTTIKNAAKEPEIDCLMDFLNLMGGNLKRNQNGDILIQGVDKLNDQIEFNVIPDRIEAGTFMIATALCQGKLRIENIIPPHLEIVTKKLKECGCKINTESDSIDIEMDKKPHPIDVTTEIYPGFPTDLQAQWMALMTIANGSSTIIDNIYKDRFTHIAELERLGANIHLISNIATISGVDTLHGAQVMSTDIRASASLVLAGLAANGRTEISRVYHIDRGYEKIEVKFSQIGCNINRLR